MEKLGSRSSLLRTAMVLVGSLLGTSGCIAAEQRPPAGDALQQPVLSSRHKPLLTIAGFNFRDLNADGALAPFEDWRLAPEQRVDDLLARMTVAEKVGTMMHSTLPGVDGVLGRAARYDLTALMPLVQQKHVTSFITRLALEPAAFAEQNNAAQEVAEHARLGIPLTISTDPRNHFQYVLGAAESGAGTTQWPELLGFAALRDRELVRSLVKLPVESTGLWASICPCRRKLIWRQSRDGDGSAGRSGATRS